jgi:hypothetical protein
VSISAKTLVVYYSYTGNCQEIVQTLNFASNTTGINNVRSNAESGVYYSLNGQRVMNPSNGIYIKNGKKIRK